MLSRLWPPVVVKKCMMIAHSGVLLMLVILMCALVSCSSVSSDSEDNATSASVGTVNRAPFPHFVATPTSGDAPLTVTFDATPSYDEDGEIVSYEWTFGDGSSGTGSTVLHTYHTAGDYSVLLTVTDNGGVPTSVSHTIMVAGDTSQNPPPATPPPATPPPATPPPPSSNNLGFVASSIYAGCDFFDDVEVMGEILNSASITYFFVEVEGTFRNSAGDVVGIDVTYARGTPIKLSDTGAVTSGFPPGQRGAFKLSTSIPCDDTATYELRLKPDLGDTTPVNGHISFAGNVVEQTDFFGDLQLSGEVENRGTVTTQFTEVIAIFKNAEGKVIDIDITYISGSTCDTLVSTTDTCVEPGESEPFEMNTSLQPSEIFSIDYLFDWDE